jgi:dipeptidyl aminopeptidase/acylaminoacyl peptidase
MIFARVLAGVSLGLAPVVTAAQAAPPGTDLYLARLAFSRGELSISAPTRLTDRPGYDNQPAFSPDGRRIYYTSIRGAGAESQADTWVLDLGSGRSTAFTDTPESEYSPTPMPGGRELAVVRVEADSTQRLWAFPLAGGAPRLLLERIKPVGYQVWLDSKTVGVYVLGSPATFQVADLPSGTARVLLSDIGRSLQVVPGRRAVSVIHRVSETDWWLTEVDPASGATRPIVKMPDGADYVVWLPDGSILTAREHALLRFQPGTDSAFQVVTDLTTAGVGRISRLAVSPKGDQLAFVAEEVP